MGIVETKPSSNEQFLLLSNKHSDFFLYPNLKMLELRFTSMSIECTSEDLKKILLMLLELCCDSGVNQVYINQEKARFIYKTPLKKWLYDSFFPKLLNGGIKKCHYIPGKYIFNKTSTERMILDSSLKGFDIQILEKLDAAYELLFYHQ